MSRRKGEGTLFKRGEIWYVAFRINGKRYDKGLGTPSKAEAEFKAKQYIELLPSLGAQHAKVTSIGLSLKEVWTTFRKRATCSERTIGGYWSNWIVFIEWAEKEGLKTSLDIQPKHAELFLEALRARKYGKCHPNEETAARTIKVIRRILKYSGCGDVWAAASLIFRRHDKPKRGAFTDNELQAIQGAFDDPSIVMSSKQELEIIHHLALHTGLRLGDCCMLRWGSVDFKHMVLNVAPQKMSRYEQALSIPINPTLEAVLRKAETWKDESGFVCPWMAAKYSADPAFVSADYTWLLKKAGIITSIKKEGMKAQTLRSFHSLRHTFISRLAEKGVSPLIIQSMAGHTTLAMTERYTHIGLEAKRRAIEGNIHSQPPEQPNLQSAQDDNSAQKKLEALKVLLKGKVSDEILALL